jgi:uncharacterized lipoprotein YbaY
MKTTRMLGVLLVLVALTGSGCSHLDVTPAGNPDRVITGTVRSGTTLPAGAEVVVRLIATTTVESRRPAGDAPIAPGTTTSQMVERVLGTHSQILPNGTTEPVPFRIEYYAEDAVLRRGLTLDARISVDGKVRYRSISAHLVTMSASAFPQVIEVQPLN